MAYSLSALSWLFPKELRGPRLERPHPLAIGSILLLAAATACGVVGAIMNEVPTRWLITFARNMLTLPASIFIGYRFIRNLAASERFVYLQFWASVAAPAVALVLMTGVALQIQENSTTRLNSMAVTSFGGDAGMIAMSLSLFSVASRLRFIPLWLRLPARL